MDKDSNVALEGEDYCVKKDIKKIGDSWDEDDVVSNLLEELEGLSIYKNEVEKMNCNCNCGHKNCVRGDHVCGCHYPVSCSQAKIWIEEFSVLPNFTKLISIEPNKIKCPLCHQQYRYNYERLEMIVFCQQCELCFSACDVSNLEDDTIQPSVYAMRQLFRDYDDLILDFERLTKTTDKVKSSCEVAKITADELDESDSKTRLNVDEVFDKAAEYRRFIVYAFVFLFFLESNIWKYYYIKELFKFQKELNRMFTDIESGLIDISEIDNLEIVDQAYNKILNTLKEGFDKNWWCFRGTNVKV